MFWCGLGADTGGASVEAAPVVATAGAWASALASAAAAVRAASERATALRAAETRRRISECNARPETKLPPPPAPGRVGAAGGRYGVSPVGATDRQRGQARGWEGEEHCSLCRCMHDLWKSWWQHWVLKVAAAKDRLLPLRMGERQMLHATGEAAVDALPGTGDVTAEPGRDNDEKMDRRAGVVVLLRFCGVEIAGGTEGDCIGLGCVDGTVGTSTESSRNWRRSPLVESVDSADCADSVDSIL